MRKTLQFILLFIFCSSILVAQAQNKYAVIVGINNYFEAPDKLSQFCLKGCVNDATSIKWLLINRFGFEKNNIISLLDDKATQPALLKACNEVLAECQPGDAFLFYYCGHGIWMYNEGNETDSIKQGFNQAICLSNLYAGSHGCLVRDNTLKKIFNQFVDKKVVVTSLFDCCFSGNLAMDMLAYRHNNYYDPLSEVSFSGKSIPFATSFFTLRSFNPSVTLTINDTAKVPRPSERKGSRFASLSACADNEKAMEIYDEANMPHGAFTKALLSVYQSHSPNLPLSQVLNKIKNELKEKQWLPQQPTARLDSARLHSNLIGIANQNFKDEITAKCIYKWGNTVVINAGFAQGLMTGNILSSNNSKIKITKLKADSATAVALTRAAAIKRNDVFRLTDAYTSSPPLLTIYIPQSRYSSTEISRFFYKKIYPFTKEKRYRDYNNWDVGDVAATVVLKDTLLTKDYATLLREQPEVFVFLPMPSDVAVAVKQELQKNQNLQLASSENDANYVLYLNYVKATNESKAGFVFTYCPAIKLDVAPVNSHLFYSSHIQVPSLLFSKASLLALSKNINHILLPALRATGTHWLNENERR